MRIAVLGVGPDRRLDRPGGARAAGRRRGRGLRPLAPSGWSARWSWARIDRAAGSLEEALDGAEACFCCAPVGALTGQVARALAAAPAGLRGHRRGLGQAHARGRRATTSASWAATRSPAPRRPASSTPAPTCSTGAVWYLTPTETSSGLLYERLHRLVAALGARPGGDRRRHPRPPAGRGQPPAARAGQRARGPGRRRAARLPRVGPELPRRHARGRAPTPAIWTDIYLANREAIADEIDATVERLREAADDLRAGDAERGGRPGTTPPASRPPAAAGGRAAPRAPFTSCALTVPNRPGIVAQVALELGQGRGEHRRHGARARRPTCAPGAMTLWIAGDEQAARARGA